MPLTVNFDGSGSSDPDAGDSLSYAWDLDGDGSFDDGAGARVSYTYTQPGSSSARLQVTDSSGAAATAQITITAESQTPAPNGLIAAYGFDEGSGASVADASGKANAGTISGAKWTTAGKFGTALTFDGINDWVTVPDANSLDLTGAMTLEAWVKPSALGSNWRTVLLKEQPGGLIYALYAHTSTQGPSVHAWIGGSEPRAASSTSIAAGSWTHLAGTYDGSALKLYVNGTFALSQTVAGPITPSSGVLRVGGNAVWSEWFSGAIDEVRLYDRALSASEIQADMTTPLGSPPPPPPPDTTAPSAPAGVAANTANGAVTLSWSASSDNVGVTRYNVHRPQTADFTPSAANRVAQPTGTSHTDSGLPAGTYYYRVTAEDAAGNVSASSSEVTAVVPSPPPPPPPPAGGLVAGYGFEQGSGSTVADSSGNNNVGTISGASWTTSGKFGSALSFDGVNDWVTVNDANSLDLTGALTLSAWVKPSTNGSSWQTIVLKEQPGELTYALYGATSTGPPSGHVHIGNGEQNAQGSTNLPAATWTNLALTYDGSRLRLYRDGSEIASQTTTGNITTSNGALRIGGNNVWAEWFHGLIDEARLYNRALTPSEIQTDMTRPVVP